MKDPFDKPPKLEDREEIVRITSELESEIITLREKLEVLLSEKSSEERRKILRPINEKTTRAVQSSKYNLDEFFEIKKLIKETIERLKSERIQ